MFLAYMGKAVGLTASLGGRRAGAFRPGERLRREPRARTTAAIDRDSGITGAIDWPDRFRLRGGAAGIDGIGKAATAQMD